MFFYIKRYFRGEKLGWGILFLCIVGFLLKKVEEVMGLVKFKLWLGIIYRLEY